MARMQDWESEMHDSVRREAWALTGPNRVVKVVALPDPTKTGGAAANSAMLKTARGYVGVEKALIGKTPQQIERVLGLPHDELQHGCRVYRLTRLPMAHEYEYELTAKFPDGLAFNPADAEEDLARRAPNPFGPRKGKLYPPGGDGVHQWRLTADVPVAHLLDLLPNATYPYSHK